MACLDLWILSTFDSKLYFIISASIMPPTKVETIDELDLRRAAALEQYLRIYAPGNRRRVFAHWSQARHGS
jgi:hypothetical protein